MCGAEKQGRTDIEVKGGLKMGNLSPFISFWTHEVAGLNMPNSRAVLLVEGILGPDQVQHEAQMFEFFWR